MDNVATVADTMDHHPEWTQKNNLVEIVLSTHDCQGVSAKDFILANVIVKIWRVNESDNKFVWLKEAVADKIKSAPPKFILQEGLVSEEEILKRIS